MIFRNSYNPIQPLFGLVMLYEHAGFSTSIAEHTLLFDRGVSAIQIKHLVSRLSPTFETTLYAALQYMLPTSRGC